jgi:PHD/YefM family antitoxin component YafN of YafNO toxin-antitoxin module
LAAIDEDDFDQSDVEIPERGADDAALGGKSGFGFNYLESESEDDDSVDRRNKSSAAQKGKVAFANTDAIPTPPPVSSRSSRLQAREAKRSAMISDDNVDCEAHAILRTQLTADPMSSSMATASSSSRRSTRSSRPTRSTRQSTSKDKRLVDISDHEEEEFSILDRESHEMRRTQLTADPMSSSMATASSTSKPSTRSSRPSRPTRSARQSSSNDKRPVDISDHEEEEFSILDRESHATRRTQLTADPMSSSMSAAINATMGSSSSSKSKRAKSKRTANVSEEEQGFDEMAYGEAPSQRREFSSLQNP